MFQGSSVLYKKFVHPALMNREQEIDLMIEQAKSRGYDTFMQLGGRGIRYHFRFGGSEQDPNGSGFFGTASFWIYYSVSGPAKICGSMDPDLKSKNISQNKLFVLKTQISTERLIKSYKTKTS